MIRSLFESCIRNISGPIGIRMRRMYYKNRLGTCGAGLSISEGVFFDNPKSIHIGHHVWVDRGCKLIGGKIKSSNTLHKAPNTNVTEGEIHIGDQSHIGINTIIQGHGGVTIGKNFTTSPDTKIYSVSNDVTKTTLGTYTLNSSERHYLISPIEIGDNVWFGANSLMVGGRIDHDTFIHPFSVVNGHFESNSILAGNPATKIKNRFK